MPEAPPPPEVVAAQFKKYDPRHTTYGDLGDEFNEEGKQAVELGVIALDGQMLVDEVEARRRMLAAHEANKREWAREHTPNLPKYDARKTPWGDLTDPDNQYGAHAVELGFITADGQMQVTEGAARRILETSHQEHVKQKMEPHLRKLAREHDRSHLRKVVETSHEKIIKLEIAQLAEKHGFTCRLRKEEGEFRLYLHRSGKRRDAELQFRGETLDDLADRVERHFEGT